MLRFLVVFLLVVNLLVFGYARHWWAWMGWAPTVQNEPERLRKQVAPDDLRLLMEPQSQAVAPTSTATESASPATASTAPATDLEATTAAPAPVAATEATPPQAPTPAVQEKGAKTSSKAEATACWQAGALNPEQAKTAKSVVEGVIAAPRWSLNDGVLPQRWLVYLGKFPSEEALKARKAELREQGVEFRTVGTPALSPGLALSTLSTEEAANMALKAALKAGVKGAKVVQERPETRVTTLKLPAITTAERKQVQALLAFHGLPLQPCP